MKEIYERIVVKYASLIDSRNFIKLNEILHKEFVLSGAFDIKGLDNFIESLNQLHYFDATLHKVSNIEILESTDASIKGSCYCVASHIRNEDKTMLDMGIIYTDTLIQDNESQWFLLERNFNLVYQNNLSLS
ncbi:MAG: nuclear transport factor 2 family protein [Gammaproteobacteria bacterium]